MLLRDEPFVRQDLLHDIVVSHFARSSGNAMKRVLPLKIVINPCTLLFDGLLCLMLIQKVWLSEPGDILMLMMTDVSQVSSGLIMTLT